MVEDEQGVEVAVWCLDDVTLHLLEFGVEERNFFDEVVVTASKITTVAVDLYTVTHIVRMLDKHEDARLKEPENVSTVMEQMNAGRELTPVR